MTSTEAQPQRVPAARLGVVVVHDLVESIVTGVVRPGETLPPEGPLSEEFAVSRTVIRESVKRVEEKGLLQVEQGRGTTVTPIEQWNMLDPVVLAAMVDHDDSLGILDEVVTVRAAVESEMAAAAALNANDADIERLRQALQYMKDVAQDNNVFRYADQQFHNVVMEMSRSWLGACIARILMREAMDSRRYQGTYGVSHFPPTLVEHELIFWAIQARDPEAARSTMLKHIETAWSRRRLPGHKREDATGA